MHSLDLLDEAIQAARAIGVGVRQEWLDGGGGACRIKGRPWVFVDLAQSTAEQLDQVCEALRAEPATGDLNLSPALRRLLKADRRAA